MRKFLTSTTALALALSSFHTMPARAQTLAEDGSVVAPDGTTVLCMPTDEALCDLDAIIKAYQEQVAADVAEEAALAEAAAQAKADAAVAAAEEEAARVAAEAAAQAEADAAAAGAAAQAEADAAAAGAAAQAEADAAAAAQAEADAAAAAQAEADAAATAAAAQAEADAAATAAAAQAEADAAAAQAAAQAEADAAAQAAAEAAAQAESAAEPAVEAPAVEAPVAEAPSVEDPAAQPEAPTEDASAAPAADPVAETAPETAADAAPDAVAETTPDSAPIAEVAPVDVPEVSTEAAASLSDILAAPTVTEEAEATDVDATADPSAPAEVPMAVAAAGAAEATAEGGADPSAAPVSEDMAPVAVVSEVVTEDNTRTSDEEFAAAPVAVAAGKKSGLSDLEKVGLLALGALVVGAVINEGKKDQKKVVSNSGDRVVVENPDGSYVVYKDDDAILRRPGVETRTETYRDGSTRTVVQRTNGTEVVTIRDASGRVLRRATYDQNGNEMILIDDLAPEERIDITKLPRPKPGRVTISSSGDDAVLKAQLAAIEADSLGRKFSLRQIREIRQVRALSATIEVDSITFDSGSAAIKATEARKLADIGQLIEQLLAANPREVFLIEGHTDAVGSAPSNLALSDRRAESLALALTEYFQIPPENLVVQGYGEAELKVETDDDERKNRRVVVRLITPLMRTAELR